MVSGNSSARFEEVKKCVQRQLEWKVRYPFCGCIGAFVVWGAAEDNFVRAARHGVINAAGSLSRTSEAVVSILHA